MLAFAPAVNRLSYEGSRFGEHADVWHHFWFDFGVGFMGLAALLVIASVVLFVREMRRSPSAEQELTGHMERAQRPVRVGNTKAPGSSALGEIDAFTRRRPHRLASLP
jgi:hypothetical protein